MSLPTKADVQSVVERMPFYEATLSGDTNLKCTSFSSQLHDALIASNVPTIPVGTEDAQGIIKHNFLFSKTDEGIIIVDPTVSQFVPSFRGVFIGTREELLAIARKSDPHRNWDEVWSPTPVVSPQPETEPAAVEKEAFNREWGSTGTTYYKDYTPEIAKWAMGLEDSRTDWRAILTHRGNDTEKIRKVEEKIAEMRQENSGIQRGGKRTPPEQTRRQGDSWVDGIQGDSWVDGIREG